MASPYQQQARQRKLIYAALILVLFTASWAWRRYVVDVQAVDLALREQTRGEVELSGALIRLSLTGLRGFATCYLWWEAMDLQKHNQWNELEVAVRSVAKLQPHFITPWLFQSWNLAYNVSVESDRVNDKYFYVTRGIQHLAEGERQNRDSPDMRWSIGFYTQHKVCTSDETNTIRSLFQLSAIPPNERDPARFWVQRGGRQELNREEFEKFCKKHPQLIRRLKDGMRREIAMDQKRQFTCQTPEAVVQFLADNWQVPSLFEQPAASPPGGWQERADRKRELRDRFPALPPPRTVRPPQYRFDPNDLTADQEVRDDDDGYAVARSWYGYAQEPIPDPDEMPGSTKPISDRTRQRKPRYMMTVIFRQQPAQAARGSAERLAEEGWYEEEGWDVPDWFPNDRFGDGGPARVGAGRKWLLESWTLARDKWREHGERNHLLFASEAEQANTEQLGKEFAAKYKLKPNQPPPFLRPDTLDAATREQMHAALFLYELGLHRNVSNFLHHYNYSQVEARPEAVRAHRRFFEAETMHLAGSPGEARRIYELPDALAGWKDRVLLKNKEYRRDSFVQEKTFDVQLRYLGLLYDEMGPALNRQVAQLWAVELVPPPAGGAPAGLAGWLPPVLKGGWKSPLFGGPFDYDDDEGFPLVEPRTKQLVLQRLAPFMNRQQAQQPPGQQTRPQPSSQPPAEQPPMP
jgi:hypothetical protein